MTVKVPVPALTNASVPVPFCITPENVVLVLSPPDVSVAALPEFVTVPAPESEPTLFEFPAMSNTAPAATVRAELLPSAPAEPAFSVPAVTEVAPV